VAEEVTLPLPSPDLHISDEAMDYLMIQRGKLSELCSEKGKWIPAYQESLMADFLSILPFLPATADRIMDVGSGMGGIDILLARHFKQPEVWLLDGDDDSPVMTHHWETFNCMRTARQFQQQNGVASVVSISPGTEVQAAPCDLIISFQAWCFHFTPDVYLDYVKACCKPGTILILDVRKGYIWWRKSLRAAFEELAVPIQSEKFDRVVFRAS
jgi:SAM-dependent methyltransferase